MYPNAQLSADLLAVLDTVTIHSPTEYSFAGNRVDVTAAGVNNTPSPFQILAASPIATFANAKGVPLLAPLQMHLYQAFYSRGADSISDVGSNSQIEQGASESFISSLSFANKSRERWQDGWRVSEIQQSGLIYADHQGKRQMFWPDQYVVSDRSSLQPLVGATVRVFLAKEARRAQPGFYFAFGEVAHEENEPGSFLRMYWNISAEGMPALLETTTALLNRYRVPYRCKCLTNPKAYVRSDAAVLYINKNYYPIVSRLLPDIYHRVRHFLKPRTPMFAQCFAPGLGFAEDPGNGESFGSNRCRLLAEGLWNAFAEGLHNQRGRYDTLCRTLVLNGITFPTTHLAPACVDQYPEVDFAKLNFPNAG